MQYNFDIIHERKNTNSVKWDKKTNEIIPMWVADMDFVTAQPIIDALIDRVNHGIFGYSVPGDDYDEALAGWLKKRHNWQIQKEWINFSSGVVPAIHMLINALTRPGDKIIVQVPVYYPFFKAIESNGCSILENPLIFKDGYYTMDFEDLEKKAADPTVKLMILCSPHNPVGRVWTKHELTKLGEICIKHGVFIIADEIHSDLIYKEYKHIPFASINEQFSNNSVTCIAPSKTFNLAGLQVSSLIIPSSFHRKKYKEAFEKSGLFTPNVLGITAATAAFNYGEEWLEQVIDYLEGNLEYLTSYVNNNLPQLSIVRPQGTYLVWLDCRKLGMNPKQLHNFFMNTSKVWFDEGYIFGSEGYGFERINIACSRELLKEALKRIKDSLG